ncbi:MAG: toxin-antitoxin system HicB family antitoxin [Bacillota bacterium]|nr:toxin-antitoxin system HicB family antitoxin [Bacillota bacterium]
MDTARTAGEYPVIIWQLAREDGGGFFAQVIDVPGCGVQGQTPEAAVTECREALALILQSYAERGISPPPPGVYEPSSYSGQFVLRIPKNLHQRLALRARGEGVSLNQLCLCLLSDGLASMTVPTAADLSASLKSLYPESKHTSR